MFQKIVSGNKLPYNYAEYICDTASDISNLPTQVGEFSCSIGSKALDLETKDIYILNGSNQWVLYGNVETSGSPQISVATISQISSFLGI